MNDYIQDFHKLTDILTQKYGTPSRDDINWRNDLFQDNPDKFSFAVSLGHLRLDQNWTTERTLISAELHGENYECALGIHYESTELHTLEEAAMSKQHSEDF